MAWTRPAGIKNTSPACTGTFWSKVSTSPFSRASRYCFVPLQNQWWAFLPVRHKDIPHFGFTKELCRFPGCFVVDAPEWTNHRWYRSVWKRVECITKRSNTFTHQLLTVFFNQFGRRFTARYPLATTDASVADIPTTPSSRRYWVNRQVPYGICRSLCPPQILSLTIGWNFKGYMLVIG